MHWKGWCGAGLDAIRVSDGRGCSAGNKLPAVPPQDFQIATAAHNRCWRALTSSRQINFKNCVGQADWQPLLAVLRTRFASDRRIIRGGRVPGFGDPQRDPQRHFPRKGRRLRASFILLLSYYQYIIKKINKQSWETM